MLKNRGVVSANPVQVAGESLVVYVYQLRKDDKGEENVAVEKVTYRKNPAPA